MIQIYMKLKLQPKIYERKMTMIEYTKVKFNLFGIHLLGMKFCWGIHLEFDGWILTDHR